MKIQRVRIPKNPAPLRTSKIVGSALDLFVVYVRERINLSRTLHATLLFYYLNLSVYQDERER